MRIIRWLTYMMFLTFAMTTDAVGVIIPEIIDEFNLTLTQAGAFHYGTMLAIAFSGGLLGFVADRLGRKSAVLIGLSLFAGVCFLFAAGNTFLYFLTLLLLSGVAIGVFKTGALALIGDMSASAKQHTSAMNMAEGFFGIGAIIGPAIVTALLAAGTSWKFLYLIAGAASVGLIILASIARYPVMRGGAHAEKVSVANTVRMSKNRYALGFSLAIMLYVASEVAIYVWMPTLLQAYDGRATWLAAYALTIFFVLRAGGRFLGAWVLTKLNWRVVMVTFSGLIFLCFGASMVIGVAGAVYLLPLSGLFMSMIYPTLNSKGISCFAKAEHGSVAGVILFFTAVAAAAGPLLMAAVSDAFGDVTHGFALATGFTAALFACMVYNWISDPAGAIHRQRELEEYAGS